MRIHRGRIGAVSVMAAYHLWGLCVLCPVSACTRWYRSQHTQVILCSHNIDDACTTIYVATWTKSVISAKRRLAPWWWFLCKPKHVVAAFLILICFNKLYMCISWTIKGLTRFIYPFFARSEPVRLILEGRVTTIIFIERIISLQSVWKETFLQLRFQKFDVQLTYLMWCSYDS